MNPHSKTRVLIVDDTEPNRILLNKLLNQIGLNSDQAEDGEEAVQFTLFRHYDLILMDCMMPKMDGYKATHSIRNNPDNPNQDTPIIAVTAKAMYGNRQLCIDAGMNDYLKKPFERRPFFELLKKWIQFDFDIVPINGSDFKLVSNAPKALPVDFHALEKMFGDDHELIDSLLTDFRKGLDDSLERLKTCIHQDRNVSEIRLHAHTIKGCASTYGAIPLSDIAKAMENAARNDDMEGAIALLPDVESAVEMVVHSLGQRKEPSS